MGVTEYPCPRCGQTQKVRAPNGSEVPQRLCAACEEASRQEKRSEEARTEEARTEAAGNKGKEKAGK